MYIELDRNSPVSLTRQIYNFLKEAVLTGTLKQGEKLPSTREMAKYLNVARNVMIESYEQLIAEGYAYTKNGSGTYINEGVLFEKSKIAMNFSKADKSNEHANSDMISFRTGIPDLDSIPIKKWGQLYKEVALSVNPIQMDYQSSFGAYELRHRLSLYLNRVRGVNTTPDNILITNGAAQAFSLLCRFVPNGGYALVENPLSYGIVHTLESNKVKIKTIPVDAHGMVTAMLPEASPHLIFTTPSHQFPTGVILTIKRRIEMIQYARKHNAYIVEDDYDSEFRFDGSPIQSMQNLDPERVIYVGTFSKTLMPALRMGYMVLPSKLRAQMEEYKYVADLHSPILEQLTMANYIETGLFDRHIKKMCGIYLRRRNYLIKCLKETFGDTVTISGAEAGMHLVAKFQGICFNNTLMHEIEKQGIEISAFKKHYCTSELTSDYDDNLIFGYGNTKYEAIELGIKRLKAILYGTT